MEKNIAALRKDYSMATLEEATAGQDAISQFEKWFEEARNAEVPEPNAMTLATTDENGRPSARIVLLKGIEEGNFVFYTNYSSRKGDEIAEVPYVALVFFWPELERQVRIEGQAEKVPGKVSDAYFQSRPRGSQVGAWVSPQSEEIRSREFLNQRQQELEEKFEGKMIPRPEHWGGYAVSPDRIEFWQGRQSRLHDRLLYEKDGGLWKISRLAP